jgi:hypothetical protein
MNGAIAIGNVFDPKNGKDVRSMMLQLILQVLPMVLQSDGTTSKSTTDPYQMLMNGGSAYKERVEPGQTRPGQTPWYTQLTEYLGQLVNTEDEVEEETLTDLPKGVEGALKVQEVTPVAAVGSNGTVVQVKSTGTEDAMTNAGSQIKSGLASGFSNLIMNNNTNARAMITSTLSQVGTNLMTSAIMSMFGSANGNVLRGGFQAFANGGLVTKPTLGLVGEGKYNEAVVPLPDGRSIPISGATGNTENNITVNVTIDSDGNAESDTNSGMDGDAAKQLGYMVSQAVQSELVEQKRPGGLLSQY